MLRGFFQRLETALSVTSTEVTDETNIDGDPGDLQFHQEVEERVAEVDDSEELDYAEDMESLADDPTDDELAAADMVSEGSPVYPGATAPGQYDGGDWNP